MLLLLACTENQVNALEEPAPAGSGEDSAPQEVDSPADSPVATGVPPQDLAPWAVIVSPESGVESGGCAGLQLVGQVGDDRPLSELVVTWTVDGVSQLATPDASGLLTLDLSPADGPHTYALSAVDARGQVGSHSIDGTFKGFDAATWDLQAVWERSAMADRVSRSAVGDCPTAALSLATSTALVWDDGTWTPASSAADGKAKGRHWASWDQVGVDCHLFRVRFKVPECPISGFRISNPDYKDIPINDNLYAFVGGVEQYRSGTSYSRKTGGPAEVDTYLIPPINLDASLFSPGDAEVLVVAEEYASWGGVGELEIVLVP